MTSYGSGSVERWIGCPARWNSIDVWCAPSYWRSCWSYLIPSSSAASPVIAVMSAAIAVISAVIAMYVF